MRPFTLETFHFLNDLSVHNDRDWFNANKQRYEDLVREPALDFVRRVGARLDTLSPHFVADARKTGGSLMRIYRDTRFSKDKTPYKTNIGIQFRHAVGKDVHAPGFYVHVAPDSLFIGAGMWRPDSASLAKIRAFIDAEQDRWRAVTTAPALTALYSAHTEDALKRPPRGYAKDHPLVEDLKKRSHILSADITAEEVASDGFADLVLERFAITKPYVAMLCEAIGVAF